VSNPDDYDDDMRRMERDLEQLLQALEPQQFLLKVKQSIPLSTGVVRAVLAQRIASEEELKRQAEKFSDLAETWENRTSGGTSTDESVQLGRERGKCFRTLEEKTRNALESVSRVTQGARMDLYLIEVKEFSEEKLNQDLTTWEDRRAKSEAAGKDDLAARASRFVEICRGEIERRKQLGAKRKT
jgi:hypothetical protein